MGDGWSLAIACGNQRNGEHALPCVVACGGANKWKSKEKDGPMCSVTNYFLAVLGEYGSGGKVWAWRAMAGCQTSKGLRVAT